MFDLASHTLDILHFLIGPIQEANGFASNQGKDSIFYIWRRPRHITLTTVEGKEQWSFERPLHVHQPLVDTIVEELTGSSVSCPSTGDSGTRTNWVMDRIAGKCCYNTSYGIPAIQKERRALC
ncbi:hypothetical protein [Rossellomorea aquimaris]|uniref:Gfo/Idh/MocA-like oxidoreductase C-terminal domain-containing protein n=1 Tax=Rossellomorea aquimaris TaxID=189382 RepID=A0A366ERD2_9BACI|nr:hypothetical protein [Rossellomorea aquimaris]RBP04948.1 hypothetical protein DET59_105238 [Rossellomorea aquimaris]